MERFYHIKNWYENNMKQIIASVFFDILSYTIGNITFLYF